MVQLHTHKATHGWENSGHPASSNIIQTATKDLQSYGELPETDCCCLPMDWNGSSIDSISRKKGHCDGRCFYWNKLYIYTVGSLSYPGTEGPEQGCDQLTILG